MTAARKEKHTAQGNRAASGGGAQHEHEDDLYSDGHCYYRSTVVPPTVRHPEVYDAVEIILEDKLNPSGWEAPSLEEATRVLRRLPFVPHSYR